jgi:hypothetical protein
MHVLILSMSPSRDAAAVDDMEYVLARGGQVTLVTTDTAGWGSLDPRISVLSLAEDERKHLLLRTERFLVLMTPGLLLRFASRGLRTVGRHSRGPIKRRMEAATNRVNRGGTRIHQASSRVHARWFKQYRQIRAWILWRVARQNVLSQLDLHSVDQIVVADTLATPLGWHIAKMLPEINIGFTMNREHLNRGSDEAKPSAAGLVALRSQAW